jgi:hypothetical protein
MFVAAFQAIAAFSVVLIHSETFCLFALAAAVMRLLHPR